VGAGPLARLQAIAAGLLQAAAGLVWHEVVPGRDHDVAALTVMSGLFSNPLAGQAAETLIEANGWIQLAPWLSRTLSISA